MSDDLQSFNAADGAPAGRPFIDVIGLAVEALAGVALTPDARLREVASLAIVMHGHETDYRAAGIGDDEIEEGCRTLGRLAAGTAAMRFPG